MPPLRAGLPNQCAEAEFGDFNVVEPADQPFQVLDRLVLKPPRLLLSPPARSIASSIASSGRNWTT
ncbi:hypothetical protein [Streptomyces sp. NPDC091219]|uniref:hypothetical protein n=1 Tax=Streptomyces sp. NPDC091219 TaxID=3155193 RepID=UPI0034506CD3